MFLRARPSEEVIARFLAGQSSQALTYGPEGLSGQSPPGWLIDESRVRIGTGEACLLRAQAAIDEWHHFNLGWVVSTSAPGRPVRGTDVAVAVSHLGFWSLNGCRVLGRFPRDEHDRRYGFFYGTLGSHAERGEELFAVEMDPDDGSVWYLIRAVSRPRSPLAMLGFPYTRRLQWRFRRDSTRAMIQRVSD